MEVSERFSALLNNLTLTESQKDDGITKHKRVRNCLNQAYYSLNSDIRNSTLVGSWGKHTRIRPPRDIDVLFVLPDSVYHRFQRRTGNRQSALLQEVKGVLAAKYTSTAIRGDGPVVVIPFSTYAVELVPGFKLTNGQYWIPITSGGGSYKTFDPDAEINKVQDSNTDTGGNTRDLIRMAKCWQAVCAVPVKSFWLELWAIDFLAGWAYKGKSNVYYDWMARDFFAFLKGKANTYLYSPGTYDTMAVGDAWKSKVESAYSRALKAVQHEADKLPYSAGGEWLKIFGTDIPTG